MLGSKDTAISGQRIGATWCGLDKRLLTLPPAASRKAGLMLTEHMTPVEPVGKTQDVGMCWVILLAI